MGYCETHLLRKMWIHIICRILMPLGFAIWNWFEKEEAVHCDHYLQIPATGRCDLDLHVRCLHHRMTCEPLLLQVWTGYWIAQHAKLNPFFNFIFSCQDSSISEIVTHSASSEHCRDKTLTAILWFSDFMTHFTIPDKLKTQIRTLRVSDWQSERDLDSNSCDAFTHIQILVTSTSIATFCLSNTSIYSQLV